MIKNNKSEKVSKLAEIYQEQKMDFLDELQPDDFRNGGSFNNASIIIEEINEAYYLHVVNKKDGEEFIQKAIANFLRSDSKAVQKAMNLANVYLDMRAVDF